MVESDARVPVADLANEIGQRWRRKRWYSQVPDQPIIHLVRPSTPERLIDQLATHLGNAVPYVRAEVDAPLPVDQRSRSVEIRNLLDKAVRDFNDHDARGHLGKFRFERYALLSWLLKQNLELGDPGDRPNSRTRELLLEYIGGRLGKTRRRTANSQGEVDMVAARIGPLSPPWWLTLIAYLVAWVMPKVIYGGPRIGLAQRWIKRQHYLAPRESADFASFAQRLLSTPSVNENAKEVRKLLVHAFLEDLFEGYAPRLWRLRWVRRDVYPVMLLDGLVSGSIGEELVHLVNDVRNETGGSDPLLIIASGESALDPPETEQNYSPTGLGEWPTALRKARRRRSPTAWYVPLQVSDEEALANSSPNSSGARAWRGRVVIPLFRARLQKYAPVLLALAGIGVAGGFYWNWHRESCGQLLPWAANEVSVSDSGECVGVATAGHVFSPQHAPLANLQRELEKNNANAVKEAQRLGVPLVTFVYFGQFTAVNPHSVTLDGAAEELAGVVEAQRQASFAAHVPMRVLLANGGEQMASANYVARNDIVPLAAADESLLGVIGFAQSRDSTYDAVKTLGAAGLPMMGSVTSGDETPRMSKLYHQVAPLNRREAAVAVHYLKNWLHTHQMSIYYSHGDAYSRELAEDMLEELLANGFHRDRVKMLQYDIEVQNLSDGSEGYSSAKSAGEDLCDKNVPVFFAGRSEELVAFLQGFNDVCGANAPLPQLLAGDDTNKFVADKLMSKGLVKRSLEYVSFFESTVPTDLPGRATLGYDATTLMRRAVEKLRNLDEHVSAVPESPMALWHGLAEITGDSHSTGRSGVIDFGGAGGQVPVNKAVSIISFDAATRKSERILLCGNLDDTVVGDPTCPQDR